MLDHLRRSSAKSRRYWNRRFARDRAGWRAAGDLRLSEEQNRQSAREVMALLRAGLLQHGGPPSGRRLLDAGCGPGHFTDLAAGLGFEVMGVDLSDVAVAEARWRYPALHFEIGDLARLDLGRKFEVIMSVNVLVAIAAVSTWRRTLATFERHLAPGGVILALQTIGRPPDLVDVPGHVCYRTLEDYRRGWQALGLMLRHVQPVWLETEQREKHLLVVGRPGPEDVIDGRAGD